MSDMHKAIARLESGRIVKYEICGLESAQEVRAFVLKSVKEAMTVLCLVNKPAVEALSDDKPPLRHA